MRNPVQAARTAFARHKARHCPTGFAFAIADRIGYLNSTDWDCACGSGGVLMGRRYLSVLEKHGPENVDQRYALVYRGDDAVACVAAQSVRVQAEQLLKKVGDAKMEFVRKRDRLLGAAAQSLARVEQRMLVCGNLLSWGCHGIAVRPGIDPASVYPGVAEALYRIRRADKLHGEADLIIAKDFTPSESSAAAALGTYSYRRLETDPNMVLKIAPAWKSYDDYLSALTSKYRGEARRIRKEVEQGGVRAVRGPIGPEHADSLHALYRQVHSNAKIRLFTLRPSFLPAMSAAFGDSFRCTRFIENDRDVGFVTTLKDGDTAIGYYVGFDRPTNERLPLYFRLLQATVEDAIDMKCTQLSLGRTALEPKARLGATPVPMEVWIRHRVPAMNLIVRAAIKGVHHDEAPERTVMKAEPRAS